mmetsp:Transcript_40545/g.105239  ORF Transcript_40545/g.105239 Transcript_40545/m.105239 type:complete len:95 (+) Transcript_40545:299-583(+)
MMSGITTIATFCCIFYFKLSGSSLSSSYLYVLKRDEAEGGGVKTVDSWHVSPFSFSPLLSPPAVHSFYSLHSHVHHTSTLIHIYIYMCVHMLPR